MPAKELIVCNSGVGRGQHPQGVRRGCKELKPQQHTQGSLLRDNDKDRPEILMIHPD
jgi:hypothetical protein